MVAIYLIWLACLGVMVWLSSVPPASAVRSVSEIPGKPEPGQPRPAPVGR
jgi:hypothetical protein